MDNVYLGQIELFPYSRGVPDGWMSCDGRLLHVNQNQALFSLIGTQFGGDGQVYFAIPNLPPIKTTSGAMVHYAININGLYPQVG